MPNWETMPFQFYTGVTLVVVMIALAIVVPLIMRKSGAGATTRLLESRDRASMQEAQRLHELATSASMSSVASAQRQP